MIQKMGRFHKPDIITENPPNENDNPFVTAPTSDVKAFHRSQDALRTRVPGGGWNRLERE
jgi:hypothetical protein